jgi:hypothetical protein
MRVAILGRRGALTGPPGILADLRRQAVELGCHEECLAVEVTNVGRLAVSLDKADALLANGISFYQPEFHPNPEPGFRLEPHASKMLFVPLAPVHSAVVAARSAGIEGFLGASVDVRMRVALGNGKSKVTSEGLLLGTER